MDSSSSTAEIPHNLEILKGSTPGSKALASRRLADICSELSSSDDIDGLAQAVEAYEQAILSGLQDRSVCRQLAQLHERQGHRAMAKHIRNGLT
jgi:hypothetical protein